MYTAILEINRSEGAGERSIKKEVARIIIRDEDLSRLTDKVQKHLALVDEPPTSSR